MSITGNFGEDSHSRQGKMKQRKCPEKVLKGGSGMQGMRNEFW